MNARSHKVIFSKRLGSLVAVGEHASAQGKNANGEGSRGAALAAALFLSGLSSAYAVDPSALPSGHQVAAGQVQVTSSGARMDIQQSSNTAILNWQSFNVGSGAKVNVVQPSSSAALLNRVVGNEMSQIHGQINANGQVVLVNPNGVLVGSSGSITASAFTASTFGISDADFESGNMSFSRNGSSAGVDNQGAIKTHGGYVALIGASVSNSGAITTGGGAALLGSGERVSVPLSGNVRLELEPAAFASVDNSGSITTDGGQVFMRASAVVDAVSKVANATVTHSGSINSSGGRVDVLADNGTVRVSGSIVGSANTVTSSTEATSTGTNTSGSSTSSSNSPTSSSATSTPKGGSIFIGRDESTNVLAAVGDVRDATLESQGGFIETSGQYLATNGVSVKAKDWLLDPSDITISNTPNTNVTGTSPGDITPTGSTGSSNVLVSTITGAINNGTNVTIQTTNVSNPTGAGNITIVDALTFTNNTADATLSLFADNGITQNAAISATGSKLVNIRMEAKGNYQGSTAPSTNSDGININAGISTNGNITLIGSTTKDNNEGVFIGRSLTLRAQNIDITGTSSGAGVPGSIEHTKGIRSFGTLNAADSITLKGTSTNVTGVGLEGGSVIAGGAVLIEGKATSGIYQGTNIGANVTGGSVTITGETRDNLGVAIGANVTATSGNVVIDGTSVNSRGVGIANGKIVRSNSADVFITGKSVVSDGINVGHQGAFQPSAQIIAAKNITLDGQGASGGVRTWGASLLTAGTSGTGGVPGDITIKGEATTGSGVIFQQFGSSARLKASNNIDIKGTVTGGAGSGSGVHTQTSETNGQSVMFNADGGKFTMTATNRDSSNTSRAIDGQDGIQVTAVGDISIKADRQTSIGNAIYFFSNTSGVGGNASFKSSNGDVLIQANKGGIIFENGYAGTPNPPYTSSTEIRGKNITIDNTGGGVSTVTGKFEAGTGTSTANGINLASTAGIKMIATQNINLSGNSTGAAGVILGGRIEVKASGDVNIQGKTTSTGTVQGVFLSGVSSVTGKNVDIAGSAFNGNGVLSYADINATSGGSATITGTSTGTGGSASALSLWAKVTADQNVTLKGENTNTGNTPGAVFTNKAITATNGKIDVTAITKGTSVNALQLHDGGSLTAKTEINLKADTLSISNAATINAGEGAGKVTISTDSVDSKINIGSGSNPSGLDFGSVTTSSRTLGLSKAELDRISAGNLVIGDTTNRGNITVSGATAALAYTGNLTLQTGGEINVNANLAAADGKNLTLQAKGDVTVGAAISQAGTGNIVIAAGLGKAAGDGTDVGQVKGTGDVTHTGTGNTYIYTGEVATSAKMSDLNSTEFATLTLGTNAQSNTDTDITKTITGSAAKTQVMYREKIKVDLNGNNALSNATKTYGEVANDADAKTALKAVNTPSSGKDLSWIQSGNNFKLNSNTLIDNLSVDATAYSTAGKLKANDTAYNTKSNDYTFTTGSKLPTLKIEKLALTGSITEGNTTYGDALAAGTVNLNNKVGTDVVSATGVTITTTGKTSTSGNLKANTHTGIQSVTDLTGDDAANYTFADVKGNYIVAKRAATISATPTQLTFTGSTLNQAAPTTSNLVAGDELTINGTSSGVATGVYTSSLAVSGSDTSNYDFRLVNADLTIAAVPVGPVGPIGPVGPVTPVDPVGPVNPFIPAVTPPISALGAAGGNRGTATLAPGLDAGFQLASAEQGQCTQDTLSFCECETAKDEDGLNIDGVQLCFEPQRGAELR